MPGENVYDWSTTAPTNATADSLINWQEGMARAAVNDSSRSEMAAVAKFRRLLTGVITTTGSANAQAFTSGVGYTAIPTGLRVLLKLGFTNTGPATLEMDGLGPTTIKDHLGNDLKSSELPINGFAEFCYNGTNWILVNAPAITLSSFTTNTTIISLASGLQNGRLEYVSATLCKFAPFGGNKIKINGAIYDIPTAGIVGLANTSIFKEGVAAQNLTATTVYYVYAFINSGVVTGDFSTTGHAVSVQAGNEGVEIKSGDNTRTLIGMVRTNVSTQFQYDASQKWVASWFNRRNVPASVDHSGTTSSSTLTEIASANRVSFLLWGDDAVEMGVGGRIINTSSEHCFGNISLDLANQFSTSIGGTIPTPGAFVALGGYITAKPAEGFHQLGLTGATSGGVATLNATVSALFRG